MGDNEQFLSFKNALDFDAIKFNIKKELDDENSINSEQDDDISSNSSCKISPQSIKLFSNFIKVGSVWIESLINLPYLSISVSHDTFYFQGSKNIKGPDVITVTLKGLDILKVSGYFGSDFIFISLHLTSSCSQRIQLQFSNSENGIQQDVMCFLVNSTEPSLNPEDLKLYLQKSFPDKNVEEIDQSEAYETIENIKKLRNFHTLKNEEPSVGGVIEKTVSCDQDKQNTSTMSRLGSARKISRNHANRLKEEQDHFESSKSFRNSSLDNEIDDDMVDNFVTMEELTHPATSKRIGSISDDDDSDSDAPGFRSMVFSSTQKRRDASNSYNRRGSDANKSDLYTSGESSEDDERLDDLCNEIGDESNDSDQDFKPYKSPSKSKSKKSKKKETSKAKNMKKLKMKSQDTQLSSSTSNASTSKKEALLKSRNWTEEEDEIMAKGLETYGTQWNKISKLLPGRSLMSIKGRWHFKHKSEYLRSMQEKQSLGQPVPHIKVTRKVLFAISGQNSNFRQKQILKAKNHLKKLQDSRQSSTNMDNANAKKKEPMYGIRWTEKELNILHEGRRKYGANWDKIVELLPGRTPTSARWQWYDYVRKSNKLAKKNIKSAKNNLSTLKQVSLGVKKQKLEIKDKSGKSWTEEEENIIYLAYQMYKDQWDKIATFLPGRTKSAVQTHWYERQRRNKALELEESELKSETSHSEKGDDESTNDAKDPKSKESSESRWSVEDDKKMIEAVKQYGTKWKNISRLFPGRSPGALKSRWQVRFKHHILLKKNKFALKALKNQKTKEIGKILIKDQKTKKQGKDSNEAASISDFDDSTVDSKSQEAVKEKQKIHWTEEEEDRIFEAVKKYGDQWDKIMQLFPDRTECAVKDRWVRKVKKLRGTELETFRVHSPSPIKHFPENQGGRSDRFRKWTEEEEKTLLEAKLKYGSRWSKIAELLPGRSENGIQKYWRKKFGNIDLDSMSSSDLSLLQSTSAENKLKRKIEEDEPPWTTGEENTIFTMKRLGKSYNEIAQLLTGRSKHSIKMCWKRILDRKTIQSAGQEQHNESSTSDATPSLETSSPIKQEVDDTNSTLPESPVLSKRLRLKPDVYNDSSFNYQVETSTPRPPRIQWTPEEDNIVLEAYKPEENIFAKLTELLPLRSERAIKKRFTYVLESRWLARMREKSDANGNIDGENYIDLEDNADFRAKLPEKIILYCSSVRIGSFESLPIGGTSLNPVILSHKSFSFEVSKSRKVATIPVILKHRMLSKVLVCFNENCFAMFMQTSQTFSKNLRIGLKMKNNSKSFYDPRSKDEKEKRIIFIINSIDCGEQNTDIGILRDFLRYCYMGERIFHEIGQDLANDILSKSAIIKTTGRKKSSENISQDTLPVQGKSDSKSQEISSSVTQDMNNFKSQEISNLHFQENSDLKVKEEPLSSYNPSVYTVSSTNSPLANNPLVHPGFSLSSINNPLAHSGLSLSSMNNPLAQPVFPSSPINNPFVNSESNLREENLNKKNVNSSKNDFLDKNETSSLTEDCLDKGKSSFLLGKRIFFSGSSPSPKGLTVENTPMFIKDKITDNANCVPINNQISLPTASASLESVNLCCKIIRIGSFESHPAKGSTYSLLFLSKDNISFEVPVLKNASGVPLVSLNYSDVVQILTYFGDGLLVMFIQTHYICAKKIRLLLNMVRGGVYYYDPLSKDETERRLIFLIHSLDYHRKEFHDIRLLFQEKFPIGDIWQEIDKKTANDILIKCVQNFGASTETSLPSTENRASDELSSNEGPHLKSTPSHSFSSEAEFLEHSMKNKSLAEVPNDVLPLKTSKFPAKIKLFCQEVKVGSYEFERSELSSQSAFIVISPKMFCFEVPKPSPGFGMASISLTRLDLVQVLTGFFKNFLVIIIQTTSKRAEEIRSDFGMVKGCYPYYDPCSEDEKEQRIIFLIPSTNSRGEENFKEIKDYFRHRFPGEEIWREIDSIMVNNILTKVTTKPSTNLPVPHQLSEMSNLSQKENYTPPISSAVLPYNITKTTSTLTSSSNWSSVAGVSHQNAFSGFEPPLEYLPGISNVPLDQFSGEQLPTRNDFMFPSPAVSMPPSCYETNPFVYWTDYSNSMPYMTQDPGCSLPPYPHETSSGKNPNSGYMNKPSNEKYSQELVYYTNNNISENIRFSENSEKVSEFSDPKLENTKLFSKTVDSNANQTVKSKATTFENKTKSEKVTVESVNKDNFSKEIDENNTSTDSSVENNCEDSDEDNMQFMDKTNDDDPECESNISLIPSSKHLVKIFTQSLSDQQKSKNMKTEANVKENKESFSKSITNANEENISTDNDSSNSIVHVVKQRKRTVTNRYIEYESPPKEDKESIAHLVKTHKRVSAVINPSVNDKDGEEDDDDDDFQDLKNKKKTTSSYEMDEDFDLSYRTKATKSSSSSKKMSKTLLNTVNVDKEQSLLSEPSSDKVDTDDSNGSIAQLVKVRKRTSGVIAKYMLDDCINLEKSNISSLNKVSTSDSESRSEHSADDDEDEQFLQNSSRDSASSSHELKNRTR